MRTLHLSVLVLLLVLSSCASRKARIVDDDEPRGVDLYRVGSAELEEITSEALSDLFQKLGTVDPNYADSSAGQLDLALAGLKTEGFEELREDRQALLQIIENQLNNNPRMRAISRLFMDRVNREAGLVEFDDLFLPRFRRDYLEVLEGMGETPDFLVFAIYTQQRDEVGQSGPITRRDITQVTYRLRVVLIDAETGDQYDGTGDVRKEYQSR